MLETAEVGVIAESSAHYPPSLVLSASLGAWGATKIYTHSTAAAESS